MYQDSSFEGHKNQIDGFFQLSYFDSIGIKYEGEDLIVENKQASLAALKATKKLLLGSNLNESEITELKDNYSTINAFLHNSNRAIENNTFSFQGYVPNKALMIQYFNEKINEKIAIITSSDFTHTQLSRLSNEVEKLKKQLLETEDEAKKTKILHDIKEQNNATLDILFDEYTKNFKKIPKKVLDDTHNLGEEIEANKELTREEFERVLKEKYDPNQNEFKEGFESNIALNLIKKYHKNIAQLQTSNPEISSPDSNVSIINQASTQIENSVIELSKTLSRELISKEISEELRSKLVGIFSQYNDLLLLLAPLIESANSVLNHSNSSDNSAPQNENSSIGSNANQSEAKQENKSASPESTQPDRAQPNQINSAVSSSSSTSSSAPTQRPPSSLVLSRANPVVEASTISSLQSSTSSNMTQSRSGFKRKRPEKEQAPARIPSQPLSATGSEIAYFKVGPNSAAAKHEQKRKEGKTLKGPAPQQKKPRAI